MRWNLTRAPFVGALLLVASCGGPGSIGYVPRDLSDYETILAEAYDSSKLEGVMLIDNAGIQTPLDQYAGDVVVIHATRSGFQYRDGMQLRGLVELRKRLSDLDNVVFLNIYAPTEQFGSVFSAEELKRDTQQLGWLEPTYEVTPIQATELTGGNNLFLFMIVDTTGDIVYQTNSDTRVLAWEGFIRHIAENES